MSPPPKHGKNPPQDPTTPPQAPSIPFTKPSMPQPGPMGLIGWTIYYIVLDGDVALTFNTRNLDEFVVDGKVLSEASPVFKALLASDLEAQRLRSAKNPQRLQIPDPKLLLGVKMLCLALHHYPYDILDVEKKAERRILPLLHLAHAARKYRAVDAMQRAISLRLLAPFEKRSLKEHDGSSQLDVDVAVIAYLLEQKDMFSVSTRRLIMDHCVPLSECGPEFLWVIPAVAISQLEEQRVAAKKKIDDMLHAAAMFHCKVCNLTAYDRRFLVAIGAKLRPQVAMWWSSDPHHTLRQVLAAIASLASFRPSGGKCDEAFYAHARKLESSEEVHARFKTISREADQYLPGLCLTCVKENREQDCFREHRDGRLLWSDQFD